MTLGFGLDGDICMDELAYHSRTSRRKYLLVVLEMGCFNDFAKYNGSDSYLHRYLQSMSTTNKAIRSDVGCNNQECHLPKVNAPPQRGAHASPASNTAAREKTWQALFAPGDCCLNPTVIFLNYSAQF